MSHSWLEPKTSQGFRFVQCPLDMGWFHEVHEQTCSETHTNESYR